MGREPVRSADVLMNRALGLLARRGYARAELSSRLRRITDDPVLIEQVIDRLAAVGYLDDQRFAEQRAASLVRAKRGPADIRSRLRRHGVAEGQVGETLSGLDEDWAANCRALAEERVARGLDLRDPKAKAKLGRFLIGRGFPPGTVYQVLRALGAPDEDG